jgi:hypothetical protein
MLVVFKLKKFSWFPFRIGFWADSRFKPQVSPSLEHKDGIMAGTRP